jgi:hypothetical protein
MLPGYTSGKNNARKSWINFCGNLNKTQYMQNHLNEGFVNINIIYLRIEHYIEFSIQRGRKWVCKNKNPILEINVGNIDGAIRSRKSLDRKNNGYKKKDRQ